jgi:hypothetical protein
MTTAQIMNATQYAYLRYQDSTMITASPWHKIRGVQIQTLKVVTECGNVYSGVELNHLTFANVRVANDQCERCEIALAQIGQYA